MIGLSLIGFKGLKALIAPDPRRSTESHPNGKLMSRHALLGSLLAGRSVRRRGHRGRVGEAIAVGGQGMPGGRRRLQKALFA